MFSDNIKLGIGPIGWTNDNLPELGGEIPFEQCVSEIALAGYEGCEVGNKFPRDTDLLQKHLALRGLQICNQWFSFELTTKPLEENLRNLQTHLDFLEAMGARITGGGEVGNSCQGKTNVPVFEGKVRPLLHGFSWLFEMSTEAVFQSFARSFATPPVLHPFV